MIHSCSVLSFLAMALAGPSGLLGQVRWEVSQEPLVSIGEADGGPTLLFHEVKGAVRLTDGSIAIGDGGSSEVRVFSSDGTFLNSFGRKGGGPREFGAIAWIDRCGGPEVVVFDEMRYRITKWDPSGTLLEGFQIEGPEAERGLPPYSVSCGPAGDFVVVGWPDVREYTGEIGPYRPTVKVGIVDQSGQSQIVMGPFPGPERYRYTTNDGPRPLGRTTRALRGAEEVYVATADSFSVLAIDRDGGQRAVGRDDSPKVPFGGRILESYKDSVLDHTATARRPRVRRALDSHQLPEFLPSYRDVKLDEKGLIWIAHFGIPGQETNDWDVFDPSGEWVASVEMPVRFNPTDIGEAYLLGVSFDSLGVERVQLYSLRR